MDQRSDLSDIFGDNATARGLLGDGLFDTLNGNKALIARNLDDLRNLAGAGERLEQVGLDAAAAMSELAFKLAQAGETNAAQALGGLSEEARMMVREFLEGERTAAELATGLVVIGQAADETVEGIEGVDASTLENIKAQFSGLIGLAELLVARIRDVKAKASDAPAPRPQGIENERRAQGAARAQAERDAAFIKEQERRRNLTVEQIAVEQEAARLRREAANEDVTLTEAQIAAQARLNVARREQRRDTGGAGGGGGGGGGDLFEREVAAIRERIAETEAEAAALIMAAGSNREYGAAIAFALQKARLINAAQRAGLQITSDLEAAIDKLANAYVNAGERADEAAENIRRAEVQSEQGARALSQMFGGILTGAMDAKEAMAQLLQRIAQVQIKAAFKGLFSGGWGGGIGGFIGKLLEFSQGGFTSAGGVNEPKGVVHGGEFVFSKKATESIGVGNLEAMHNAARSGASGGGAAPQSAPGRVEVVARVENGSIVQDVRQIASDISVQVMRGGLEDFSKESLPGRVKAINNDPRLRG